jgi:hypothetical protein
MLAYAWNFDGATESDNSLSIPVIRRCGSHGEYTEHSEAQCYSYPFKQFHDLSPVVLLRLAHTAVVILGYLLMLSGSKEIYSRKARQFSQTVESCSRVQYRAWGSRLLVNIDRGIPWILRLPVDGRFEILH